MFSIFTFWLYVETEVVKIIKNKYFYILTYLKHPVTEPNPLISKLHLMVS